MLGGAAHACTTRRTDERLHMTQAPKVVSKHVQLYINFEQVVGPVRVAVDRDCIKRCCCGGGHRRRRRCRLPRQRAGGVRGDAVWAIPAFSCERQAHTCALRWVSSALTVVLLCAGKFELPDELEFLVRSYDGGRNWEGDADGGWLVTLRSIAGTVQCACVACAPARPVCSRELCVLRVLTHTACSQSFTRL